jgi:hypothetical protein
MDERWDVFAEDNTVFVHRSWTGFGIFDATFAPAEGDGWRIAEAVVERDRERYRKDGSEYDRLILELVLSTIVLGETAPKLRAQFRSHLNLCRTKTRFWCDQGIHSGWVLICGVSGAGWTRRIWRRPGFGSAGVRSLMACPIRRL